MVGKGCGKDLATVSLDAFGAKMVASLWAHDFLTFWNSLVAKYLTTYIESNRLLFREKHFF